MNMGTMCNCGRSITTDERGNRTCKGCDARPLLCMCVGGSAYERHQDALRRSVTEEQPQPHGEGLPVGERLIELIRERTKLGMKKYGEPSTTHNGRDTKLDALQESIDLNQYLMQALIESEDLVKLTDAILEQRSRVLKAIPECNAHGDECVPHALDWVKEHKRL